MTILTPDEVHDAQLSPEFRAKCVATLVALDEARRERDKYAEDLLAEQREHTDALAANAALLEAAHRRAVEIRRVTRIETLREAINELKAAGPKARFGVPTLVAVLDLALIATPAERPEVARDNSQPGPAGSTREAVATASDSPAKSDGSTPSLVPHKTGCSARSSPLYECTCGARHATTPERGPLSPEAERAAGEAKACATCHGAPESYAQRHGIDSCPECRRTREAGR